MSDAASDAYLENLREDGERKLYMEMMGKEALRRDRAIDSLLKFLRNKSSKNREGFCRVCTELNTFDAESVLDKLLKNDEAMWAALLQVTKKLPKFNQLRNFSPFSKEIFTFDWLGEQDVMVIWKEIEGKKYTRIIPVIPFFKPPLEITYRRWKYYRP